MVVAAPQIGRAVGPPQMGLRLGGRGRSWFDTAQDAYTFYQSNRDWIDPAVRRVRRTLNFSNWPVRWREPQSTYRHMVGGRFHSSGPPPLPTLAGPGFRHTGFNDTIKYKYDSVADRTRAYTDFNALVPRTVRFIGSKRRRTLRTRRTRRTRRSRR